MYSPVLIGMAASLLATTVSAAPRNVLPLPLSIPSFLPSLMLPTSISVPQDVYHPAPISTSLAPIVTSSPSGAFPATSPPVTIKRWLSSYTEASVASSVRALHGDMDYDDPKICKQIIFAAEKEIVLNARLLTIKEKEVEDLTLIHQNAMEKMSAALDQITDELALALDRLWRGTSTAEPSTKNTDEELAFDRIHGSESEYDYKEGPLEYKQDPLEGPSSEVLDFDLINPPPVELMTKRAIIPTMWYTPITTSTALATPTVSDEALPYIITGILPPMWTTINTDAMQSRPTTTPTPSEPRPTPPPAPTATSPDPIADDLRALFQTTTDNLRASFQTSADNLRASLQKTASDAASKAAQLMLDVAAKVAQLESMAVAIRGEVSEEAAHDKLAEMKKIY